MAANSKSKRVKIGEAGADIPIGRGRVVFKAGKVYPVVAEAFKLLIDRGLAVEVGVDDGASS